ncbi:MAG: hypothetical protein K5907_01290 [Treponema sp.]|nr:hypothetical protein [Treponema sp.]
MIYVQTSQTVFPKSVYIGDKAELRCTFKHGSNLPAGKLSVSSFTDIPNFTLYDISSISLVEAGPDTWNLVLSFVPWHTGRISFPDFELEGVGFIHFEDVQVLSLVEQEKIEELQSYSSPLVLPGTAYKIYAALIAFVVFLIVFIRLIVKRRAIIFWAKNFKLKRRYSKNRRVTLKQLKYLCTQYVDADANSSHRHELDSVLATAAQRIMREYLEVRLAYPFTKKLTSELYSGFEEATGGLADENRTAAFEDITSAFFRTDYVRFSEAKDAVFAPGEFMSIINNLIDDIYVIEEVKK